MKESKQSQIEKFRNAARELEADDSEEAFDAKLKKIAKATQQESTHPKGKKSQ